MGVSIETALRWEQNHVYQIPEDGALPPAVRKVVDYYFATGRAKDWDARLKEYWTIHEYRTRDTEKYGDYKWADFSPTDLKICHAITPDTCSLYQPEEAEERKPLSYQLRSTVEMCNEMRHDEFHGFMSLPSEIRDMIYSYALHKGKVIVPNVEFVRRGLEPVKHYYSNDGHIYRRYDGLEEELHVIQNGRRAPTALGLVQGVGRAVHDEAARIYFGGNQFIFPAGAFFSPQYCNRRGVFQQDFNHGFSNRINNAPLLRDVSYTFDMRDKTSDDYNNLYWSFDIKLHIDSRTLSPGEALQALHDQKALGLEIDWVERIDSIKRMTLDRLVLDFEECYCAVGCCRKVEYVLDRFLHEGPPPGTADTGDNAYSSIDWLARPPLVVEVMGFVNDDEEVMALEKLRRLQGSEIRLSKTPVVQDHYEHTVHEFLDE